MGAILTKTKQQDPRIAYLMDNPTNSGLMNVLLRTIAQRITRQRDIYTAISTELPSLQPSDLRKYAKRKLTETIYPQVERIMLEHYPNATEDDIRLVVDTITNYVLDEAERTILG